MTATGRPGDHRRRLHRRPGNIETPKTPERSVREETRLSFREETHYESLIVSPLPPPEILRAYKDVQDDIPERILRLVETQTAHRQTVESRTLDNTNRLETIGLIFGFIVVLAVVGIGIYLLAMGRAWSGSITIFGILAGVAKLYLSQQKRRDALFAVRSQRSSAHGE